MTQIEAAARADEMGGGRHHRRHLLGRERVVVAGEPRALAGKVLKEELQLIPERSMQTDLAVGAPAHLHASLELGLARGPDRDHERRSEQRGATGGLEIGQQVPRLLGALEAEVRGALLPLGLRTQDLVSVLNPTARDPDRQLVGQEAGVEREVDPEREAFRGGEHELRPGAGEVHALRQRAEHQLRLPAAAPLGVDHQRAPSMLDDAVAPAHHVALERREHGSAVALERERPWLVEPVDLRFADTAAEAAPDQPLQLHHPRRPHLEEVSDPRVGQLGGSPCALELLHGHEPPVPRRQGPADLIGPILRGCCEATPERNEATSRSGSRRLARRNTTGCDGSRPFSRRACSRT